MNKTNNKNNDAYTYRQNKGRDMCLRKGPDRKRV